MPLLSPYLEFSRETWRKFREDTPLTLTETDLVKLKGQNEPVSLLEVEEIYLPLSRLLSLYVEATQALYQVTSQFLGNPAPKVPYIIAVAGSVAVGKSTTSRILRALLARWPNHPRVELITTDGYLYPNAILTRLGLMNRKGFPESYDLRALIQFLSDLKAGKCGLKVPVYSHHHYDIIENEFQMIDQPDIVIVEGLNVLQATTKSSRQPQLFVSDFFDFTIYVDAQIATVKRWYLDRFMTYREKARQDVAAFFYQFAQMATADAYNFAEQVWTDINELNLIENILPFKQRAQLILEKAEDHAIEKVYLRKL